MLEAREGRAAAFSFKALPTIRSSRDRARISAFFDDLSPNINIYNSTDEVDFYQLHLNTTLDLV